MNEDHTPQEPKVSYGTYTAGYVLSVLWTLLAYVIVAGHILSGTWAIAAVVALAVVQLVTQLIFFLHLGQEGKPRWNLAAFLFTVLTVFVIVAGSLWIMHNLNYNMMSPHEMNDYMKEQNKAGF